MKKVAGRKSQVENQGTSSENGVKKVAGRKWKVKEPPPKPSFCLLSPSAAGFTEKAIKTFDL